MEESDCLNCMQNGAFESSLATDIEKERIKDFQFTNVDTDSDVESTEVSIPSLEQLTQELNALRHCFLIIIRHCYPQPALVTAVAPYHLVAVF